VPSGIGWEKDLHPPIFPLFHGEEILQGVPDDPPKHFPPELFPLPCELEDLMEKLLDFLFPGGPPLPAPYPGCGDETDSDPLPCKPAPACP